MDIAKLGYAALVIAGKHGSAVEPGSADKLLKETAAAQADRRVVPGKVAVIGFSQGGGGAVVHAPPCRTGSRRWSPATRRSRRLRILEK